MSRHAGRLLDGRGTVHSDGNWLYLAMLASDPVEPLLSAHDQQGSRELHAGVVDVPHTSRQLFDCCSSLRVSSGRGRNACACGQRLLGLTVDREWPAIDAPCR